MNLEVIEKYIHLTPLPNGNIEVMFSGQPCLSVHESYDGGFTWKINQLFAKLSYGANIFEDVPYCYSSLATLEEAIADGLSLLNGVGAFHGVIDLPADTYVEEHLDEGTIKDIEDKLKAHADTKITHEAKFGKMNGTDLHQHEVIRKQLLKKKKAAQTIYNKHVNNESVEDLDERADREDDEGYARTKKSDDAYNASIARRKTAQPPVKRKTPEQEKAEWDKWVKECLIDDCRKEALKHSDSIMEAQDLAQGLLDSVMDELNEINADVEELDEAQHSGVFKGGDVVSLDYHDTAGKTHHGKANVYNSSKAYIYVKHPAMIDHTLKFHQTVNGKNTANEVGALPGTRAGGYKITKLNEELDEGAFTDSLKARATSLVKKLSAPIKDPIADEIGKIIDTQTKRKNDVLNKKYAPKNEEVGLDEAALSGDAYWKAKEAEAKETKAKAERASMGIKEPVKKGRGKPTNIDLDFVHAAAKKNVEDGKRPTAGMERNEKIHFVRHLSNHPDFADKHVAAAGRPTGTTAVAKAEKVEKKKAETSAFSMWAGLGKK